MSASVITLNKGRDAHLARLLEGLAKGPIPRECIVVEMGAEPPPLPDYGFSVCRVVLDLPGLPLAKARNAGRRAASGEHLVYLDVDCIPSADLVDSLDDDLAQADGLVCCEVRYLPAGAVADGWTQGRLHEAGQPHPVRVFPRSGLEPTNNPGLFWSLAFGVRAATFDRLGGFDEAFDGYGAEDTDLAFRAAAAGVPVLLTARGEAYHQHHAACDPPLQHFDSIVANARRFHARHGLWPMDGWLDAFARRGHVSSEWRADGLTVLRTPSPAEIAAARVASESPF
ncbi:MAG: galactosyltransferase-related protein [Methylobacterium sp.]|uniref:glycosyltransferase family 2 protein n=1 Tax=unclassified Methylobacterium TaxID=2615210 RepID=UPI0011CBB83C|nr:MULTISPECIES: galactosyltransferase-related protein [unclassified Methylobacterium]MDO9426504.1 galactosyltransferase-related protein [Methylobacterium sp.]TXM70109.1 glycosyltransferase family 2 protein [Methylobacterium sp. WL69]